MTITITINFDSYKDLDSGGVEVDINGITLDGKIQKPTFRQVAIMSSALEQYAKEARPE